MNANAQPAEPPHRRRRRLAATLAAMMVAGCASPTRLRWPEPEDKPPSESILQVSATRDDAPESEKPAESDKKDEAPAEEPLAAAIPPASSVYPIDLTTALRLAEVENPRIAETRQRVLEALGVQKGANVLLLPSLNAGFNYHGHNGDLQRSSGRILSLSEQSLYFGGGAGGMAAGTVGVPAVNLYSQLTDAIFSPLAARQDVAGARFNVAATANNILREVAELHFELIAAEAEVNYRRLTAQQAREVERLTKAYVAAGENRPAEAHRAETERHLIEQEIRRAEEEYAVASTRLVHRLHLDPNVRLKPIERTLRPIDMVEPAIPLPGLIATALARRPELRVRAAAIAAAEARHKQEQYRPWLPTVQVGFSGGGFGGGSNLVPPTIGNFAGRTDFDVMVFWTVQNFGFGNLALMKRRFAEVGQAVGDRSRQLAEVRAQVAAAQAEVAAARLRVEVTARQLKSAEEGFREDLDRIKNTVSRPIEVVNSLKLLDNARIDVIRAITDHNQAQVRLFVALGSPPPLERPATDPIPPAPVASPPVSASIVGAPRS